MDVSEPEIEATVVEPEIGEPEIRIPDKAEILEPETPAVDALPEPIPAVKKKRLKVPVWG